MQARNIYLVIGKSLTKRQIQQKKDIEDIGSKVSIFSSISSLISKSLLQKPDKIIVSENIWLQLGSSSKQIESDISHAGIELNIINEENKAVFL